MKRKVAILGAGIGAEHLEGYLALPQDWDVAVICDRDAERAAPLAKRANARVETEIAAVVADGSVDLIDICLPPDLHVPVALQALSADKHVIVEKPVAGSVDDADALAAAAKTATGRVFPVFQYRYGPGLRALQRLQAAGVLGRPLVASLETHWNRGADYYSVPWRGTWSHERGGAVLGHAIHIHDLIGLIFGKVQAVTAMTTTRVNAIETEDCAAIAMEIENGALVTSSITLGAAEDSSRLRLVFEHATVESDRVPYAPGQGRWSVTARNPQDQPAMDALWAEPDPAPDGFTGYLAAVAAALNGRGTTVSLDDGCAAIELVTAIYHSARSGRQVVLPLDRSLPICRSLAPNETAAP